MSALAGRIGPNAITRVAEVLLPRLGQTTTTDIFARAGLAQYLLRPPDHMVEESEVTRLHLALRESLGEAGARGIAYEAGNRTGDYLLANRIPKAVQAVLKRLPARVAAPVLLAAIRRHAWTFAGSGVFTARAGFPVVLTIRHNPLCRGMQSEQPACAFYSATFQRLFRALVHPEAQVREQSCEAMGAPECVFTIRW